jgi:hypothetical protein
MKIRVEFTRTQKHVANIEVPDGVDPVDAADEHQAQIQKDEWDQPSTGYVYFVTEA